MLCPIGYFECGYRGLFIDMCDRAEGNAWRKIKSIKTISNSMLYSYRELEG